METSQLKHMQKELKEMQSFLRGLSAEMDQHAWKIDFALCRIQEELESRGMSVSQN
jgi:hypothetical protein